MTTAYSSLSPDVRNAIHGAGPTTKVRITWIEPIEHAIERCQMTDRLAVWGWAPPPSLQLDGERISTAAPFEGDVLRTNLETFRLRYLAHDVEDERALIKAAVRTARAQAISQLASLLDPSGQRVEKIVARLTGVPFGEWPDEAKRQLVRVDVTTARTFFATNKRSPRFVAKIEELGAGQHRVAPEEADRERIVQALSGQNPNAAIDRLADLVAQLVAEKVAPAKGKS